MLIHNTEHTFYYIDPSLESGGDGSSVANAANAFPTEMNTDNVIYLVRRTSIDTKANFPKLSSTKNWNTPKSVVFMGMPKSTDELFASMPEDAKTSWVDAEQDYAYVNEPTTGSYTFSFGNCANFHMSRICFMTNRTDDSFVVECANDSYGTNVTIDHCWFRTALTDFTQESASKPDRRAGKQYLRFNNTLGRTSNFSRIINTRIDLYGSGDGIALAYTQNIYIDNCTFNLIQNENESRSAISWYWDDPKWGAELRATNLTAHYYYSDMRDRYMAFDEGERNRLMDNIAESLGQAAKKIQYRAAALFYKIAPSYGEGVGERLKLNLREVRRLSKLSQKELEYATK